MKHLCLPSLHLPSLAKRLCLLLVFSATSAFLCQTFVGAATVTGQVLDQYTRTGIPGITISVYPVGSVSEQTWKASSNGAGLRNLTPIATTETLVNGSFILRLPKMGLYTLVVWPAGATDIYYPGHTTIEAKENTQGISIPLKLIPSIRLQLRTPDGKRSDGTFDTTVWTLYGANSGRLINETRTAINGLVTIPMPQDIPLDRISRMLVEVHSNTAGCCSVKMNHWDDTIIPVQLNAGATLTVRLHNAAGALFTDPNITAIRMLDGDTTEGQYSADNVASVNSEMRFSGLFPGAYVLVSYPRDQHSHVSMAFRTVLQDGNNTLDLSEKDAVPGLSTRLQYNNGYMEVLKRLDPDRYAATPVISGRVLNCDNHLPAPDIKVDLSTWNGGSFYKTLLSGSDGSFSAHVPGPDCYSLHIDNGIYSGNSVFVRIPLGSKTTKNITLDAPQSAAVHFVSADGAAVPIAGQMATVWIWALSGSHHAVCSQQMLYPDALGNFRLFLPLNLTPEDLGAILIEARVDGLGCGSVRLESWTSSINIPLTPGVHVNISVVDDGGKPIRGAYASLQYCTPDGTPLFNNGTLYSNSDANGNIVFGTLIPDVYLARIYLDGSQMLSRIIHTSDPQPVIIKESDPQKIPHTGGYYGQEPPYCYVVNKLDPNRRSTMISVTGAVQSSQGQPLSHASVRLTTTNNTQIMDMVTTRDDGTFDLRTPIPGDYRVSVEATGHSSLAQDIDVGPQGKTGLVFNLSTIPVLKAQLLTPDGKPAIDAGPIKATLLAIQQSSDNSTPNPCWTTETLQSDENGFVTLHPANFPPMSISRSGIKGPTWQFVAFALLIESKAGCAALRLQAWPMDTLTIHLETPRTVNLRVLDATGKPVHCTFWVSRWLAPSQLSNHQPGVGVTTSDTGQATLAMVAAAPVLLQWTDNAGSYQMTINPTHTVNDFFVTPYETRRLASGDNQDPPINSVGSPLCPQSPAVVLKGRALWKTPVTSEVGAVALLYPDGSQAPVAVSAIHSDGRFELHAPSSGPYRVVVGINGTDLAEVKVNARTTAMPTIIIPVETTTSLRLKLFDATGIPVTTGQVQIWLSITDINERVSVWSSQSIPASGILQIPCDGRSMATIGPIDVWVWAGKNGYGRAHFTSWSDSLTPVRLAPGLAMEGSAIDADGQPLAGLNLTLTKTLTLLQQQQIGNEGIGTIAATEITDPVHVTTDPTGHFNIPSLERGRYTLSASHSGETTSKTIILPHEGPVQIVVDSDILGATMMGMQR